MNNYFKELHPFTIIIYELLLLIIYIIYGNSWGLAILLPIAALYYLYHYGLAEFLRKLGSFAVIVIFFGIFNVCFYHGGDNPFLYVNDIPLTWDALTYGIYSGCLVSLLFVWFNSSSEYMGNERFIYCFGKSFPRIALVLSIVSVFYERFKGKIDRIKESQKQFENRDNPSLIKRSGRNFTILLTVMLEDSVTTADSMECRGYGKGKRSSYKRYKVNKSDITVICLSMIIFIAFFLCYIGLRRFYGKEILLLLLAAMSIMLPVIYDCVMELRWKLYESRI